MQSRFLFPIFIFALFSVSGIALAQTTLQKAPPKTVIKAAKPLKSQLEVSGWIPYWRKATGTAEALAHLDAFTELNPFGYTVKKDGTLADTAELTEEPWTTLIAEARKKKVRIIPTVMWSDTEAIHRILTNTKARIALEDEIRKVVRENKWDGIDIDFEGKRADTKNYYSTFLKGLNMRLKADNKWLMCTIEARTPLDSRFDTIPATIRYANDFVAINRYCNRVRLMTYDQGTIDVKLNRARSAPYIPVADPGWVEKVLLHTMKTIPKGKLMVGIATYGYEYKVTKLSEYGYRYDLQWAFNPKYALDLAGKLQLTPVRQGSNELGFVYRPSFLANLVHAASAETGSAGGVPVSTTATNQPSAVIDDSLNILVWSDAKAMQDKISVAKRLGIRGISIFKIDGGADPGLWPLLH
ncbi:MAG: glycosyl hydrolase family 18 protein [bacterium]|nr:glycosyl hydrolase family 18 protein [bacterium]